MPSLSEEDLRKMRVVCALCETIVKNEILTTRHEGYGIDLKCEKDFSLFYCHFIVGRRVRACG